MKRLRWRRVCARGRRGMAALQVVMLLGTLFTASVVMYQWASAACRMLYHFLATMVGAPY